VFVCNSGRSVFRNYEIFILNRLLKRIFNSRCTMLAGVCLVIGAGFAGSVVARELADAGRRVHVIDKRPHIAGNAYDEYDAHGVLIHNYGPHIFHTNSERIFEYLSRFTAWHPYEHRVRAVLDGKTYPFPINRDTLNQLYGLNLE